LTFFVKYAKFIFACKNKTGDVAAKEEGETMKADDGGLEVDEEGERQRRNGKLMLISFVLALLAMAIIIFLTRDVAESFKDGVKATTDRQEAAEK
jgi:hypothetical protein